MHPLQDLLGDVPAFFRLQRERLARKGIVIDGMGVSHVAYRCASHDEYLALRRALEAWAVGNAENVWNGRPISKILLREPLALAAGHELRLIELIPPPHQRRYKMGLEHVGLVVGEAVDDFGRRHRAALTGQQFQSPGCEPYYVLFTEDYSHVKFYRRGLQAVCEQEGARFDRFQHVTDWPAVGAPDVPPLR